MNLKNIITDINKRYPEYTNFINNHFIKNKRKYFQDDTYNYSQIPRDCRTNSFLENYNNYIKHNLGKKNIVLQINFIEFIYDDIERNEKNYIKILIKILDIIVNILNLNQTNM